MGMTLAVNIGNTNIRVAVGSSKVVDSAVFYARDYTGNMDIVKLIESEMGTNIWEQIDSSVIATVVPDFTHKAKTALESKINKPVRRIDIKNCGRLKVNKYEGLLGEDRVVCCARALQKFSPPFVVIDFGTATTINAVNKHGEFLGGAILTGLQTGVNALTRSTAQLPQIRIMEEKLPLLGKNTTENIKSGAVIGHACAVEGYISRIEEELKTPFAVIATGGHGPTILPYCRFEYIHEPLLLLEGLLNL